MFEEDKKQIREKSWKTL